MRWFSFIFLLVLLWIAHFFVDVMLGIWSVYKTLAHLDLAKAGMIVAVSALIGEGSQLIFGTFSDRGFQKTLIIAGLLATTASAFLAYSVEYVWLFVFYLMTCIGSGCFHPSAAGLVNSLMPARRGLLMAIFASGGSLGLAVSQLVFTKTHAFFEGHTYVLALPAVFLAIFFLFYRFPQVEKNPNKQKFKISDVVKFLKKPVLRHLYFAQVANQSILWGTIFILPDALKSLGHTDWVCYGGGHLFFILGAALMMVPAGYLADAYSARRVMLYASLVACIAFYTILYFGGMSMMLVLTTLFVLGSSLALFNPVGVSLGTRFEPQHPGAISALLMGLVWCVSEAVGPGGVGLMTNWFSDYAPVKALAVLGGLFLIQIYFTFNLPQEEEALEAEVA